MNAELLYDPPTSADHPALDTAASKVWHRPAFWPLLVLVVSLLTTAGFWSSARLDADRVYERIWWSHR